MDLDKIFMRDASVTHGLQLYLSSSYAEITEKYFFSATPLHSRPALSFHI